MKYFNLDGGNLKKNTAFAYPVGVEPIGWELADEMTLVRELPFQMELVNLSSVRGKIIKNPLGESIEHFWLDYQPNQLAWPLMSQKMAEIVQKNLTGAEGIEWISAPIKAGIENREYFVPIFTRELDVLDLEYTSIDADGFFTKPYFSLQKLVSYAMFHFRKSSWNITLSLVINENMMKALKDGKLSGVSFDEVPIQQFV